MTTSPLHSLGLAVLCMFFVPCICVAQLLNGDFDSLSVGTAPDDNLPAGAWFIPNGDASGPQSEGPDNTLFSIVPTSQFDTASTGNSLHVQSNERGGNVGFHVAERV